MTKSKNLKLSCVRCKRSSVISKWKIKIPKYYIEPYSCMGGGYWTVGKKPDYRAICPKCDIESRILSFQDTKEWNIIHNNLDSFGSAVYFFREDRGIFPNDI